MSVRGCAACGDESATEAAWAAHVQAVRPNVRTHRLVGDDDTALSQDQLDIAQAEAGYVVDPNGAADDLPGNGWR